MNRLAIPTILAATVLVAGIFVFMPVQQASTVHTTLASLDSGPGEGGFSTISFDDAVAFAADADRIVLLDIHEEVDEGFVVLRTDTTVTCASLQIAVTNVAGAIQGTPNAMGAIAGNDVAAGGVFERLCHAHVPTDTGADSVFVTLTRTTGNAETIPAHSTITTTIASIDDDVV